MEVQGWQPDPWGRHDDRWFSHGTPTKLVRDQGIESYDEPPRELAPGQLPLGPEGGSSPQWAGQHDPRSPAGGQEWPARERKSWPWWTVVLPGVPALAMSGFVLLIAGIASAMACMDTCMPALQARASTAATVDAFVLAAIVVLLAAGLAVPAARRVIAPALSLANVLAIGFVALHWP